MGEFWVLAVLIGIATWVDDIGRLRYWPSAYRLGLPLRSSVETDLIAPSLQPGTQFETPTGVFRIVSPGTVLVRQKTWHNYDSLTWLPWANEQLRGTMAWGPHGCKVTARFALVSAMVLPAGVLLLVLLSEQLPRAVIIIGSAVLLLALPFKCLLAHNAMKVLMFEYREWARLTSASS